MSRVEVVYDAREAVAHFVTALVPACGQWGDSYQALGFALDGELIGGTVFHNWNPDWGCIEMSSAAVSPRWLTRDTLRAIFSYAFDGLGCRNVVMRVSSHNERMRSIGNRYGFTEFVIPNLRADGESDCIFVLSRTDWEKGKFNG